MQSLRAVSCIDWAHAYNFLRALTRSESARTTSGTDVLPTLRQVSMGLNTAEKLRLTLTFEINNLHVLPDSHQPDGCRYEAEHDADDELRCHLIGSTLIATFNKADAETRVVYVCYAVC